MAVRLPLSLFKCSSADRNKVCRPQPLPHSLTATCYTPDDGFQIQNLGVLWISKESNEGFQNFGLFGEDKDAVDAAAGEAREAASLKEDDGAARQSARARTEQHSAFLLIYSFFGFALLLAKGRWMGYSI